jgi:hypothetical protein
MTEMESLLDFYAMAGRAVGACQQSYQPVKAKRDDYP